MKADVLREAYSKLKIAVVGDFIQDEWWRGSVTRINPEAPVPVVENPEKVINLGGAGNVAVQLRRLGAHVWFHTVGGYDKAAKDIMVECHNKGIVGHYHQDGRYNTPHKLRIIGNGCHIVRVDCESTSTSQSADEELLGCFMDDVRKYDAVVLSDYNKGVLQPHQAEAIIKVCNEFDVPTFVNSKAKDVSHFFGCTVFQCNGEEFNSRGGVLKDVLRSSKARIITHGSSGLDVYSAGQVYSLDGHNVKAVETPGAGDTVLSVFTMEYLRTEDVRSAAELANKAGAIVVQKEGIAHCTVDELCGEVM